jgi:UDP-glucuronate 4-epimerase
MSAVLVTGAAGFIGFHLCHRLLERGERVVGLDNLCDYDVQLKRDRLKLLEPYRQFTFHKADLVDQRELSRLFHDSKPSLVMHLAAQAGVRYSISNPSAYINSNLVGFGNLLECCRHNQVQHLVYASSSSVYGANRQMPFSVLDRVDHPISLYAATKRANELMAHAYSAMFALPATGLRFFTVYGPWGRPDMAIFRFCKAILEGSPIEVYNQGNMQRDFTYIDDVIEGVVRVMSRAPLPNPDFALESGNPAASTAPFRLYNIGNHQPVELLHLISILESCLGRTAQKRLLPMQPGDVPATFADVDDLRRDVGFEPSTPIEEGIQRFVAWYKSYYATSP